MLHKAKFLTCWFTDLQAWCFQNNFSKTITFLFPLTQPDNEIEYSKCLIKNEATFFYHENIGLYITLILKNIECVQNPCWQQDCLCRIFRAEMNTCTNINIQIFGTTPLFITITCKIYTVLFLNYHSFVTMCTSVSTRYINVVMLFDIKLFHVFSRNIYLFQAQLTWKCEIKSWTFTYRRFIYSFFLSI